MARKPKTDAEFDQASVEQLRRAAEAVPPQKNPRAAKSLGDLKQAIERIERKSRKQ